MLYIDVLREFHGSRLRMGSSEGNAKLASERDRVLPQPGCHTRYWQLDIRAVHINGQSICK